MAKLNYTNTDLLKSIKLGCMVPVSQIALSDEDILFLATEELCLGVVAGVMKARQEYNVYIDTQDVNDTNTYPIPSRASGGKLRSVFLKDSANQLYKCTEISVDAVPLIDNYYGQESGAMPKFYLQNDKVIFLPNVSNSVSASTVELHYYLDPSELVLVSDALTIQSIERTSGLIEVDERQIPSTITVGTKLDFIKYRPQNVVKKIDATVVSVSSNSPVTSTKFITVDVDDIPDDLEVGDFIAVAGESPVPQLVANLRGLLAQATICRILQAQGDTDNIKVADAKLKQMVKDMSALIQDRTEGNPQKIVPRTGILRSMQGTGRRNRGG